MAKKKDPKYDTELDKTVFSWGIISTDVTIANLMKKKARGGYDNRYVVLSRNYIMYYKPATKEGAPHKYDLPKGVINLRRVKFDEVRIDPDNSSFLIPTSKRTFEFKSQEDKILTKWVRVVKERAEVISNVRSEEFDNFMQDVQQVQLVFPKNFAMAPKQKIENIDKIIEDRTKYNAGLKQWDPHLRKACLFLECYFGPNRNYLDWFVGSDGPSRILQNSEEDMLAQWKADVEKALKAAPEIATIRFFQEDMEETAQLCDKAVLCIDGINRYYRLFIAPDKYVDQYVREKEVLQKFAASFRAFPSERSIDYRTSKGGVVSGKNGEEFSFTVAGGMVTLKGRSGNTDILFHAQGPELISQNLQHGTVVWNGRAWVWYHPRYPHTIRFDLDPKSNSFRFRPSPSAAGSGKNDTIYADWVWEGGVMRNVGGGGGKKVPACGEWRMDGDVPVSAVLLVGMAELIAELSNGV